jgi:hypothetical protein
MGLKSDEKNLRLWAERHFSGAALSDVRRVERVQTIA